MTRVVVIKDTPIRGKKKDDTTTSKNLPGDSGGYL